MHSHASTWHVADGIGRTADCLPVLFDNSPAVDLRVKQLIDELLWLGVRPNVTVIITQRRSSISVEMKVATFNVNGVNGRLPRLLEWLDETRPDVACLQEIKTSDPKFPHGPLREAGYSAIWHGQPSHHGVAILAREMPVAERRRGLPGDETDRQARYLEADIDGMIVAHTPGASTP